MDIASIVPINIGRGWGEGSHQLARPFGQGGWSCPAPSPQPSPARGEGARSPFDQGRYCYFNGIGSRTASPRDLARPVSGQPQGHSSPGIPMNSVFDTTGVQPLILEILARHNRFQPKQLEEIGELLGKANPGAILEAVLIKGGYLSDQEVANLYAEDLFLPLAARQDASSEIDKELASLLPEKLCTDKLICPMALRDEVLDVAFVSPETMGVVDELQLLTGLRINPLIGPLSVVEFQLDALYRANRESKAIGEGGEDFHDAGDQL